MVNIIGLLEQEMQASIQDINKDSDSEITLEDVKVWFFETEKLIRTIANLSLEVTSQQGINQLRYAAHHILKSDKPEDTIEAYKHCKRAYYDTLDLFILTLNDRFVTSLVYVEDLEKRTNIAEKLKKILIKIQAERFKTQARVDYYAIIQSQLIEGLNLLEELSLAVSISSDIQKLQKVIDENEQLRDHNNKLESDAEKHIQKQSAKITKSSYLFAILIAILTPVGLLFQGSLTDYFRDPITKVEHSLNLDKAPTPPIGKK
jgi:NAD-specific glutamate dehydrogenase